ANTQPAILTVSVAAYRVFIKHWDGLPSAAAGHSLGEYSAIVAANGMKFADAVRIVRKRGLYMQEAVPVGTGAMAAIIGLDTKSIEEACIEARTLGECAPANYNSPKQVVIAGTTNAVEKAMELAKSKGAKRAIKLNVSAPFHCSLMQPAAEKLAEELREIEFFEPDFPIVHNFDALFNDSGKEISGMLKRQVASPVLWQQSVENMAGRGIDTFIEIGPGKVLSGLIKQIYPEAKTFNIADTESLNETINSL
ncbi:MAG TPA: ACP S-malonyltransferase, partial [Pyrinomonadaceae bacterium]|nr:ACP S-malonyltransferase [Pyrinomonadaceae bacterium]